MQNINISVFFHQKNVKNVKANEADNHETARKVAEAVRKELEKQGRFSIRKDRLVVVANGEPFVLDFRGFTSLDPEKNK